MTIPAITTLFTIIAKMFEMIIGVSLCVTPYSSQNIEKTKYDVHENKESPAALWALQTCITCGIVIIGPRTPMRNMNLSRNRIEGFGCGYRSRFL